MSRIFGPVRQNGYVVGDLHTAVRRWTSVLGVGPFFVFDSVKIEDFRYHGAPSRPDMSIALACSGGLQIQLIQQHNDAPSLARDFRAAHGEGLQHLTAWTLDFEADLARLTDLGYGVIQQGRLGANRFVYFDTAGEDCAGAMELYDVSNGIAGFFDKIRKTAERWDGSDPVRLMS